jgi:hypothetical protein
MGRFNSIIRRLNAPQVAALGFIAFIGLSLLVVLLMRFAPPLPREACEIHCRQIGMRGELHYSGPASSKSTEFMSECICK